jgi:hypothetical protein
MAPWKLPLLVIAIAVPIVGAFAAGGPGVGVSVGALAAVGVLAYAARQRPRGAIGEPPKDGVSRLLVVVGHPVEDPAAIAELAREVRSAEVAERAPEVLVLAPARIGFLDRWASDVEEARGRAQRNLVITVASLAKAGVAADARVGDEDLVQAVEDAIGGFPATEVILLAGAEDEAAGRAAAELDSRLRVRFRHIQLAE